METHGRQRSGEALRLPLDRLGAGLLAVTPSGVAPEITTGSAGELRRVPVERGGCGSSTIAVLRRRRTGSHTASSPSAAIYGRNCRSRLGLEADGLEVREERFGTPQHDPQAFSSLGVGPEQRRRPRGTDIGRTGIPARRPLLPVSFSGFHGFLRFTSVPSVHPPRRSTRRRSLSRLRHPSISRFPQERHAGEAATSEAPAGVTRHSTHAIHLMYAPGAGNNGQSTAKGR